MGGKEMALVSAHFGLQEYHGHSSSILGGMESAIYNGRSGQTGGNVSGTMGN
jgi:hypothetical protein